MDAIRELHEVWHRIYRPGFAAILGDFPPVEFVDSELNALRARRGTLLNVRDLRRTLRTIAQTIDNEILPAYAAARWTEASVPPPERVGAIVPSNDPLIERLESLNPTLAKSYRQALLDLQDPNRESYLGPAGELREVLRATIHLLAPDDNAIQQEPWYKGHEGRPTQAERVRFIMQTRSEPPEAAAQAADLVEIKTGALGRVLYRRASRALHAGTERDEVAKLEVYVRGVLLDIVPAA